MEAVNKLKPVRIMGWKFTHFLSHLDLLFVNDTVSKDFGIGCRISFSDTGNASLQFRAIVFVEEYAFPVGERFETAEALVKTVKKRQEAYKGFFDRLPKMEVNERDFIQGKLSEAGSHFQIGPVNIKRLMAEEEKSGGFEPIAPCREAMERLLRMARHAGKEAVNTQDRLYQTFGYFFDQY